MKRRATVPLWTVFLMVAVPLAAAAAQDPSDEIYREDRVATFDLVFDDARAWDAICNDGAGAGDQWWRADLRWGGEFVEGVGVKRSGEGTRAAVMPKPPVRMSFNEFEFANPAGPGTPGRKWKNVNRIKLDNCWEAFLMGDRIGYAIFLGIGAPAPRTCHARLVVDGDYKGVYAVEEPVRKDFVRYRWSEEGGNLYNVVGYTYGWRGSDPASYIVAPGASGVRAETNYPGGDYSDFVRLVDILNNSSSPGDLRTRLEGHVNLDGFLAHLAALTVIEDGDSALRGNNHFWYHRADTNRLEIIKWDVGASYAGQTEPGQIQQAPSDYPIDYQFSNSPLGSWISRDAVTWDRYKAKLRQALDGPLAGIQTRIDTIYNQIRDHAYADRYKGIYTWSPWGGSDPNGYSNAEFDAGVVALKDWYSRRISFLRSQVGTSATNDAAFVSQNIPATMTAGQGYSVTVAMRNSGTTTWTPAAGYRLNSRGPYDNTTWGVNRIALAASDSIAPGQTKSFAFTMTAPATPGTYLSRWSMANNAAGAFGATTPDVNVTVTASPPPGTNGARFVSQVVPSSMSVGQTYPVTVTVRNSGATTWTDTAYRLGSQNPVDNMTWGMNRVSMSAGESIAPGQEKTFAWTVTAPATAGTYDFQWRMRESGVEWFGDLTANVSVQVLASGGAGGGGDSGSCGALGPEAVVFVGLIGLARKRRRS